MTSHNDQLRALISEIDASLAQSPGVLGRLAGDRAANRATLQHLRDYLANLQNSLRKARIHNQPTANDLPALLGEAKAIESQPEAIQLGPHDALVSPAISSSSYNASQALLYQFGQDLDQLRTSLLAPLQAEVQKLQQQRQILQRDIRHLETHRQQLSPTSETLLQEFLQTLMVRLQERLVAQVAEMIHQTLPQTVRPPHSSNGDSEIIDSGNNGNASATLSLPNAATASDLSLAQVEQLQTRANALVSHLDKTMQVFSKTLEQNIQGYQHSLAQRLERMHQMGNQGEALMTDLVNRLANQMEVRSSTFLPDHLPDNRLPDNRLPNASLMDTSVMDTDVINDSSASKQPPSKSISSAGIARQRVMAAQASERQDQQALERNSRHQASSLEDFYASFGAGPAVSSSDLADELVASSRFSHAGAQAQAQQLTAQQAQRPASPHSNTQVSSAQTSPPQERYRDLDDDLFDGISTTDTPWSEQSHPAAIADSPQPHRIQLLTDLVDHRFDDFHPANGNATVGLRAVPPAGLKKNTLPRQIAPAA